MKRILFTLATLVCLAVPAMAYEDITPSEAYMLATADPSVFILDVRTIDEWKWVGHPGKNKLGEGVELDGKVLNISYEIDLKGALIINPSFLCDVKEAFPDRSAVTLITICRSGSRSLKAAIALEEAGYKVMNMLTGFEGSSDAAGYRTKNGWKIDGLPYSYVGDGYRD